MAEAAPEIMGHLRYEDQVVPIAVQLASKYTLWVRLLTSDSWPLRLSYSGLTLFIDEHTVDLGPCRLISEPNIDGYSDRLLFTDQIYDLERLLRRKTVASLQTEFVNLPLLLGHKNKIKEAFKDYTADLTYDLSVYRHLFDAMDTQIQEEPETVRLQLQRVLQETEGRKFFKFLDDRLRALESMVANFSREEHERHGYYFRRQLWDIILCSPIMARTNLKPRGYSGDSEMMLMIYSNDYQGHTTFGQLMHKHPVEHPAAQAVRNRRVLLSQMLKELRHRLPGKAEDRLKILSVACGPAFEIKDLLLTPEDCRQFHFTLLDQDRWALNEAAHNIFEVQQGVGTRVMVNYLTASVRTMLGTRHLADRWGQFDFIYSMGLFDYLTPPVATAVLDKLVQLLQPGGEMVIGNFHVANPGRCYMEYWLDWVLYYRTEEDMWNLIKDGSPVAAEVLFEDTRSQMFLRLKKK